MERLKSGILLVMIGLTTAPVLGQYEAPGAPSAGFVAVVGDVARCMNYPVPGDAPLTVWQAVQNAGMVSDKVNVKVIRATQDQAQFTLLISATSSDGGEPVENGDILLVQSLSPMTAEVRKNAALRTDSGVIVVGLEEDGIRIGDVLLYAQTSPPAEGQIKVISRFQGQPPISKAELYSPTLHGDVISISQDNRQVLKGFGNMAPAVSEWKNQSAALPSTSAPSTSSDTGVDFSFSEVPSNLQPFEFPASPANPVSLRVPGDDTPESGKFSTGVNNDISASTNALPISQSEDLADIANDATVDGKVSFASESSNVAPMAPAEIKTGVVTAARSSNFNPWNLVFVGGLLLAGTLILAGTLRPDPDDNSKFIETAARESIANLKRFGPNVTASQSPVATPTWQDTPKAKLPIEKSADVLKSPETSVSAELETTEKTNAPAPTANSLVASHEWFGGDWNGRIAPGNTIQTHTTSDVDSGNAGPGVELAEANLASGNAVNLKEFASVNKVHADVAIPDVPDFEECSSEMQTPVASMRSVTEGLSAANVIANDTADSEIVSAITDTVVSADDVTSEIEGESETLALEDLLHNRLPIDLCEAQLPLRIALFGRPAGPRRLRIDAAHKTVPPPHVNLTADKRREQKVTVAASAEPQQSKADSSGGLDRALHFLQERTES